MLRFLVLAFCMFIVGIVKADEPAPTVQIECGGEFGPRADNVKGSSGETTLKRLTTGAGTLEILSVAVALAGHSRLYNEFCPSKDAAEIASCRAKNEKGAIDDAIEKCKKAAIARGDDDTLYRCKKETCPEGSPGCVKKSTNAECTVPYPKLDCKCSTHKVLDTPTLSQSTASCMCSCTCEASGSAEMQCNKCDGGCVEPGGNS